MIEEVVRFDSHEEGTVTVSWNHMCGAMPTERDTLLQTRLGNFAFTHCCGGTMQHATTTSRAWDRVRQVLWCRLCGARLILGLVPTLRDLLLIGWPKEMVAPVLGQSQEV